MELLIDADARVVQFFAITSAERGCGRKMVEAVVRATPLDWFLVVAMDWSGGFWQRMARDYPDCGCCDATVDASSITDEVRRRHGKLRRDQTGR